VSNLRLYPDLPRSGRGQRRGRQCGTGAIAHRGAEWNLKPLKIKLLSSHPHRATRRLPAGQDCYNVGGSPMYESAHIRSLSVAAPAAGNSKTETYRPFRRLEQTAYETQVELADPILAKLLNAP